MYNMDNPLLGNSTNMLILKNYDQYEIVKIDATCYKCILCKHYVTLRHNDETIVVFMDAIDIYNLCILKNVPVPSHIPSYAKQRRRKNKKLCCALC